MIIVNWTSSPALLLNGSKGPEYCAAGVLQGFKVRPMLLILFIYDSLYLLMCPLLTFADDFFSFIRTLSNVKPNDLIWMLFHLNFKTKYKKMLFGRHTWKHQQKLLVGFGSNVCCSFLWKRFSANFFKYIRFKATTTYPKHIDYSFVLISHSIQWSIYQRKICHAQLFLYNRHINSVDLLLTSFHVENFLLL